MSQLDSPKTGDTIAIMETTLGTIKIKLFVKETPKTCANFIALAAKGYYDGTIFHRVIQDFMIQGGDPTATGMGGESIYGQEFEDEFAPGLTHVKGALSMANAGPNTNGSQFFIVQAKATPHLNRHHSVFGQTYEGMDVVDTIANMRVDRNDRPMIDIQILSLRTEEVR
ncbi:MAG: peptidylprolyl isomerase [Candidatus Gracilibacteria bacterium]|nr:peptidylprolyl isomerase [Candidatus Gracilibacteria bacterium]